jgi:hypothetical protein
MKGNPASRVRIALAAAVLSWAVMPCRAQAGDTVDKAKAKEHFFKAKTLFEEGALEKAIVEFNASYEFNPVPMVIFNIAVCYDKLTRFAEAITYYKKFLDAGKGAPADMVEEAKTRVPELEKFTGSVKLKTGVSGAEVSVDGKAVGMTPLGAFYVEAGEHELVLKKEGFDDARKKFKVVSGEETILVVEMKKAVPGKVETAEAPPLPAGQTGKPAEAKPSEKPSGTQGGMAKGGIKKLPSAAPFWTMLSLTAALGLTAAVTGGLALKKDRQVSEMHVSDPGWQDLRDESHRLALTTDILLGVGASAAVTAIVLAVFTDFRKEKKARVSIGLSPAGSAWLIGLSGSF